MLKPSNNLAEAYISQFPAEVQHILTSIRKLIRELAPYKQGKGSVQFPLDQPIPYALIERIVRFRIAANQIER